ncbi:MAG: 2-C-methyl-D-erythritol 2,4-cyclodiphosphate synthase [Gammaproteobacteria bacterium]|nr:2-C-methyl-D-erythritol 2,4-cyclodiphosphate synthase [Gammaproteobacteria bacterium]MDD9807740.1 2-C-methyl-D-erythritol 2,4-cyclodiphosphate synthase [Gammaproteobacteria bacterium]MDD9869435.1 2-C-methyl-D-erythritol 2,4-cyclodiphosphate synthase [Gammaproteobacteria bacterium]MDD9886217.1 2-C-methyl-D-erythritol 2,4-cyclodiphosphate synthase [Gammaproteobacteria bacterium]
MNDGLRIGHGYDVHAFCKGRYIVIGGVRIPFRFGLKAHSDGDVLIHSVCDALLGAAALGDIGSHFPDHDEAWEAINSRWLLCKVHAMLSGAGFGIINIDSTLVAQAPQMQPHIARMRDNLAADLSLAPERISIKATTTERLGFAGREEGLAAHSIALIGRA